MRIFVTGGTGFIGRHVVSRLKERGDTVQVLSRQVATASDDVQGDLSNIDSWKAEVERFRPEAAVHLAWEGIPDYSAGPSVRNLENGLGLIKMLAEIGCRTVLCTGSCWEYGKLTGKVGEEISVTPATAFSVAKTALHWLGREIAKEKAMNFIWTRLFYVYGPGQKETSLIPHVIRSIKSGKQPDLKNPRAGNDFVYVGDVAKAIVRLLGKPAPYGLYNIGSGVVTSVGEIAETIASFLAFSCESAGTERSTGTPGAFWADISKIERDADWRPNTSLRDGIKKTIEFY